MTQAILEYEMTAGGDVCYEPQRAEPDSGFGPYEVHPQRVRVLRNGAAQLAYCGEWIVLFPPGSAQKYFAVTPAAGGRTTAEKLAALQNSGLPTRVVDLTGLEKTSLHTTKSVQSALDQAA